jgi:hypothetical protein
MVLVHRVGFSVALLESQLGELDSEPLCGRSDLTGFAFRIPPTLLLVCPKYVVYTSGRDVRFHGADFVVVLLASQSEDLS